MEKNMIKFEDIINFVYKAMDKNLIISTLYRDFEYDQDFSINIKKKDDSELIDFTMYETGKLFVSTSYRFLRSDQIEIDLTEKEILKFKSLVLDAQEYSKNLTLQKFNTFFKDDSKPTDINDLDNDDE